MNTEIYNAVAAIDPGSAEKYKVNCKTIPFATACAAHEVRLPRAFTWEDTPEGHQYWSDLCRRLPGRFGWDAWECKR